MIQDPPSWGLHSREPSLQAEGVACAKVLRLEKGDSEVLRGMRGREEGSRARLQSQELDLF